MKSSAEFANLDELESAIAQFRSTGVPGGTMPKVSGKRGGGPYTISFDFVPESEEAEAPEAEAATPARASA